MSKARINGIDIHYQSYGHGDAIVFAHGAGGNLLRDCHEIISSIEQRNAG